MTIRTAPGDRFGVWCGCLLVAALALVPFLGWLWPLGFTALLSLLGLLGLPALASARRDAVVLAMLGLLTAWACASIARSTYQPARLDAATGLKLVAQLFLYAAALGAARRADPRLARTALVVLSWGLAVFGVLLLIETFTGAGLYSALRAAIDDPLEFPYARKNLAQASFVLALLWPIAAAAGARAGAPWWLAAPMAGGTAVLSHVFLADAPTLAVCLALAVGALTWGWPRLPKAVGLVVAGVVLLMPLAASMAIRAGLAERLPLSWAERMGYWDYAVARIREHPWGGWGLDASRSFSPHIELHPHNGALQVWLELGAPGAALAAMFWAMAFGRLASGRRDAVAAGATASATVYVLFGLVSFGAWQEWWLALGALVAVILALARRLPPRAAASS